MSEAESQAMLGSPYQRLVSPEAVNSVSLQDVGSIGELIAAIATVATLIYLTIEIKHNSRALERSNEFAQAGLTEKPSQRVSPPSVAESPIQFECEVFQIVPVGEGPLAANVVIGRILLIHISESVLNDRGKIDPGRLDTVGRLGGFGYCRTTERFELKRVT